MIKGLKMLGQIALLYAIYLIGSWIEQTFMLPIPGSVIGMILLFILLLTRGIKDTWIQDGASWMVNHIVLFIIPATVGVMSYFSLFMGKGFLLILIVLLSTIIVLVTTGLASQWIIHKKKPKKEVKL